VNPYPVAPVRRRRWPWVVPVVLLVLAVSVLEGVAMVRLVRGPAPHADALAAEQVLDAPVAATPLGHDETASRWGFGDAVDQPALARAAFQVDLDPEAALAAWIGAYGERYGLSDYGANAYGRVAIGTTAGVIVVLTSAQQVALPPGLTLADIGYRAPAAGATVVTVEVLGLSDLSDVVELAGQS
jgi:hypothetical protein